VEIEDFSQLEEGKKRFEEGDLGRCGDGDVGDKAPFLKKWGDRFILVSPSITDEIAPD